jgi:hypothetical protein
MSDEARSDRGLAADGLLSPREEDEQRQRGKLDEELRRMAWIAEPIGPADLLLLCNESFASTNEPERALFLRALPDAGFRLTPAGAGADQLRRRGVRAGVRRAARGRGVGRGAGSAGSPADPPGYPVERQASAVAGASEPSGSSVRLNTAVITCDAPTYQAATAHAQVTYPPQWVRVVPPIPMSGRPRVR